MQRWKSSKAATAKAAGQGGLFERPASASRSDPPQTSRQARTEVLANGVVAEQASIVLRYLRVHPEATAKEIADYAMRDGHFKDPNVPNRRLPELEARGLVRRGEPRRCRVGGKLATTWEACQ